MKKFYDLAIERTSVRNFKDGELSQEMVEKLTNVINNAPTSINHQQFSAIIVQDRDVLNKIGRLNFNQKHIKKAVAFVVFLADRTRLDYTLGSNGYAQSPNSQVYEYTRAVTDTVIAATMAHDFMLTEGYGITYVGGILNFIPELKKLLNIPQKVIPVVGLSIGIPNKVNNVKPKFNKVFREQFDYDKSLQDFDDYNEKTKAYFNKIGEKSFKEQAMAINSIPALSDGFEEGGIILKEHLQKL